VVPATPSPLKGADRLRLHPVAVRRLGPDLLVGLADPDRPVERLTGSAPALWDLLGQGLTIAEAARRVADETGVAAERAEAEVLVFARTLVAKHLAEPA
jgi:Coenzyme PQQ synthesis protein D (PqqD)